MSAPPREEARQETSRRGDRAGAGPPWARRPGESRKAYHAFLIYRDLGADRSLRDAAAHLGKHVSLLKRWSGRYAWQERVAAWDEQEREQTEAATRQAQQSAYERRVANAEQLEKVAMAGLRSLMVRDPQTGEVRFDKRLKPGEIAALLAIAFRMFPTRPPTLEADAEDQSEAFSQLRDGDIQTLLSLLGEPDQAPEQAKEVPDDESE